jgi:uncharacterized protein YggE
MKRFILLALISIMLFSFTAVGLAQDPRTICVTGEAEVRVVPDEVVLSLGVESNDIILENAVKQNDERTRKVMAAITEFNIGSKFIQTSRMEIRPLYNISYNKKEFNGYLVSKGITLTIRNTDQFEAILKSLLEAGADNVNGIRFGTTESSKYKDQARVLAIRAAKEKAVMLAKELGQHVGKPLNIKEETFSPFNIKTGDIGWSNGLVDYNTGSKTGETFALGQMVISASITVEFELLD